MVIFAFAIKDLTDRFELHPMSGAIIGSILACPISLLLPETKNNELVS